MESYDVRRLKDDEFYGLLQFTCGLPTPALSDGDASTFSRAVTVGDVRERRRSLRSWLLPQPSHFQFVGLTDIRSDRNSKPAHTWLLDLSRHTARKLPDYGPRGMNDPLPLGFPSVLDWNRPAGGGEAAWEHFLRVQRARDDTSHGLTAETDCNDYMIRDARVPDVVSVSLWELQLFFCEFLAQRRGAIFASHVSERIYNIWLPPGVITFRPEQADQRSCFAVLPVITVVRRPYRIDWRYAMSLSVLFVPRWPEGEPGQPEQNSPRPIKAGDVIDVVTSTSGNTTYIHDSALIECRLSDKSPLHAYLTAIVADDRRDFCSRYTAAKNRLRDDHEKLRHWIELLLLTAADLPKPREERVDDRILPEYEKADDRILPDEVLRCLRVNSFWSAMLLTDKLDYCEGNFRIVGDRWWPGSAWPPMTVDDLYCGVPPPVADLFKLFADRNRAFPPTPDDRVDVLSTAGRAHMTWRIPSEHIIVTAYRRQADEFPSFSSLNLVGWFAYMAVGVTCAWQTMYSLTHDTDKLQDVAELSQLGHDRIMDLEDVYDLDVGWTAYAEFYRRLRNLLGVEREYLDIKDRLELLFRFAQAEQRTREERKRYEEITLRSEEQQVAARRFHEVERAAAVVGACILLVSVMTMLVAFVQNGLQIWISIVAFAAVVVVGTFWTILQRLRIKDIDDRRGELIASLARLAQASQPPSPDGTAVGRTAEQPLQRTEAGKPTHIKG